MNTKIIIESLSMDLLRAALGRYRGSVNMAERFEKEALARTHELQITNPEDKYLKTLISKTDISLKSKSAKKADELLMYSVLFKNLIQAHYPLH